MKRYPGDILENHGPYYKEGMAPGLGAWGYFSKSKADLTPELVENENGMQLFKLYICLIGQNVNLILRIGINIEK